MNKVIRDVRAAMNSRAGSIFGAEISLSLPRIPKLSKLQLSSTRLPKPKEAKARYPIFFRFGKQDQILFAKRLSMILRSGMPIMEGLHMIGSEAPNRSSRFVYDSLIVDVTAGRPLSVGMQKFERMFGEFSVNIVRVGEASGTLHENLEYLAEEMKRKQALRRKVIGALIYPAVIVVATIAITVLLTVYIFPKIIPIFTSVKATLPFTTRALIAISGFLGSYGLWLLGILALLTIGFFVGVRFPTFHYVVDSILLRIPILGRLSRDYNLTNISRTLSLLLKSDVRIVYSLELVAGATRNRVYRQELFDARERLVRGQKISAQFKARPKLFPPLLSQMVTVGETTGNLAGTLAYLSEMYEEDINELTKNLTTLIEPILMLIMGLIVGFIAISIITPIYSITQSLSPK